MTEFDIGAVVRNQCMACSGMGRFATALPGRILGVLFGLSLMLGATSTAAETGYLDNPDARAMIDELV